MQVTTLQIKPKVVFSMREKQHCGEEKGVKVEKREGEPFLTNSVRKEGEIYPRCVSSFPYRD